MSIFSSMRYCLGPPSALGNLWAALAFMPFGLFFDFMDGKVARWRKKSSLMGQELDSLADLVRSSSARLSLLSLPTFSPSTIRLRIIFWFLYKISLEADHIFSFFFLQISFGVSPAAAAFALGLRTPVDHILLTFFVLCGLTRLARFNITVANVPKDASGKSQYFEGTPIPTSLCIATLMAYWVSQGWILENLPLGTWAQGSMFEFHPVAGLFVLSGCLMTSKTIHIPKP